MYIILLSAEYPPKPGGVGDYTRRLALALAERGHRIDVLTSQHNGTLALLDAASQTATELLHNSKLKTQNSTLPWSWRCWNNMAEIVARERPDVLHIQYQTGAYGMHPAINLLPRYLALRGLRRQTAVVVTFHDLLEPYLFPKAGRLRHWITLRLARDADWVVATNEADARKLEAAEGRRQKAWQIQHRTLTTDQRTRVIPIGSNIPVAPPPDYDRERWREKLKVKPSETLVAYFGLLSRSKGVDLLLDALVRLGEDNTRNWKLLLIGGETTAPHDRAYAAEIAKQIARLQLQDRIIRTGQVDEASVSAHLLAADIVALPFRDGASFRRGSLLAALAHGCAVVTTENDGTESGERRTENRKATPHPPSRFPQIENGENALLIPPNDSAALATALERLAGDAVLRARLGQGARILAAPFGWDEIARQHEEMYQMQKTQDARRK